MAELISMRPQQGLTLEEALNALGQVGNHRHTELAFGKWAGPRKWQAEVFFINSSGSSIHAKSEDDDPVQACIKCAAEIERLW